MNPSQIQTIPELVAAIQTADAENRYLTHYYDDPIALLGFYISNYDFGVTPGYDSIVDYKDLIERLFKPEEFHFDEGDGGLSFHDAESLFCSIVSFRICENFHDYDAEELSEMIDEVEKVFPLSGFELREHLTDAIEG